MGRKPVRERFNFPFYFAKEGRNKGETKKITRVKYQALLNRDKLKMLESFIPDSKLNSHIRTNVPRRYRDEYAPSQSL